MADMQPPFHKYNNRGAGDEISCRGVWGREALSVPPPPRKGCDCLFGDKGIFAAFRWEALWKDRALFIDALGVTLQVSLYALVFSLLLGIVLGLVSSSKSKVLRGIVRVYVEFFQNTPLVLQLLFLYYAVMKLAGGRPDKILIGVVGLTLYHGAYIGETVRGGIAAISHGQWEAAQSQGFTRLQTMLYIILPQTIKLILPPLANHMSNLIKNTSVMAIITGGDLMYRTTSWAANGTLSYGPAYLVCGVLFFVLCFPLTTFARRYEEALKKRDTRAVSGGAR